MWIYIPFHLCGATFSIWVHTFFWACIDFIFVYTIFIWVYTQLLLISSVERIAGQV